MITHNNNGDVMKNESIWSDYRDKYDDDKKVNLEDKVWDILIIGGGITGITTAYYLKDSGYKVLLIDKGKIGNGITGKTTAKITYLQKTIYQDLEKLYGKNKAYNYYKSQKDAIKMIKKIVDDEKIECDFKKCSSVIFTLENKGIKKIYKEKKILEDFGSKVYAVNSNKCVRGIKINDSYMFNPLKFIDKLSEIIKGKVRICENVMADKINYEDEKYIIKTSIGNIHTKKLVVACHYPFFLLPLLAPVKTYIKREYVSAGKMDEKNKYMAICIDKELHSIRFYKDYLIYGSNDLRLTSCVDYKKGYDENRRKIQDYFSVKPEYSWMNQDMMSNDYLPFIGKVKNDFYIAFGYNAWGMTNGVLGAKIISDLILNRKNEYQELFNPRRINLVMTVNSLVGLFHYIWGYILGLVKKNNPKYVEIDGILYGIYRDKEKKEHIVKLVCPHMKCFLVFNEEEMTWDCPCHGSRFDINGKVITGPACKEISINNKEKD